MVNISRIASNFGRLIFDPHYSTNVSNSIRVAQRVNKRAGVGKYKNLSGNIKDAFLYAEKKAAKTPFWESVKNSAKTLFPDIAKTWKDTKGIWGKLKGVGKQVSKRLPLIGAALTVAFELPNIVSAFKDKGLVGGITEIGKSGARLGGFMAGMAVGQALIPIPIVGGIVGGMLGDWLVSKVTGKSHSEQKAEAEQKAKESTQAAQTPQSGYDMATGSIGAYNGTMQPTLNQQQLAYMQQQLYGGMGNFNDDFMMNAAGMNQYNQLNPLLFQQNRLNYSA